MSDVVWLPESVGARERAEYLNSAGLAAEWYMTNQNSDEHPWGIVRDSADHGRFVYEYYPTRKRARGNGVWGQAVAIMGLLGLHVRTGSDLYKQSALMAAEYLRTLQIWDPTQPQVHGAFREHVPQDTWGYPRDGATGAMGLLALHKATGEEEDLDRTRAFADWYLANALDQDGWPCWTYHYDTRQADWTEPKAKGVWQAGSALLYYQLYKVTGEERYLEKGAIPLVERALPLLESALTKRTSESTIAADDFAMNGMLGVYLATEDQKYLDAVRSHLDAVIEHQEPDGRLPGSTGAMYIHAMTLVDFCRISHDRNLGVDLSPYVEACHRLARFALTMQERELRDPMAYGGFYGQTNYALDRDRIHHRATGYSLVFHVRYEGKQDTPFLSAMGW